MATEQAIARALMALAGQRFSGALIVDSMAGGGSANADGRRESRHPVTVRCDFAGGRVVWAQSSLAADAPARLAVHAGAISAADGDRLATASLDEVAAAAGLAGERAEALRQRLAAHAAMRLFAVEGASPATQPGAEAPGKVVPIDVRWLIYRGVRACFTESRITRQLGTAAGHPFSLTPGARLEVFRFAAAETQLVARLSGGDATIDDLCRAVPALSRQQVWAVLYALWVTGAAVSSPSGRASAAQQMSALIPALAKKIDAGEDHFAVLGKPHDASVAELREAYFAFAKKLHPDRLRAAGITADSLIREAKRVLAHLNQAFAVLSDPARRTRYEQSVATELGDDVDSAAAKILAGENCFRRGEAALRRGRITEAVTELARAVELSPQEGEHHAALAWATWLAAEDKAAARPAAIRGLERALDLSPRSATAHFYRGQIAKDSGNNERALASFRRVLELSPHHADAKLEVRLLEGRQRRNTGRGGLFGKRR